MEFICFVNFDDIQRVKSKVGVKFVFFQLLPTLQEYQHINTDIYVQFQLTSKLKHSTEQYLIEEFFKSPIYIGELLKYISKQKKIYNDTRNLISAIAQKKNLTYYGDIIQLNDPQNYYTNQIFNQVYEHKIISFLRF